MKKTELVEIIRSVVKEEINNSLPQYLMEVLAERITAQPVITETEEKTPAKPTKRPNVNFESPIKQPPAQAPKTFTSNPILNAVLNETVGGVPLEEETTSQSAIDVIKSIPKEKLNENKEVAAVASALTRDYSKLLKAVDEKAKAKRPM